MKRIGRILSLTVILTVLATMFCFAAPAGDGNRSGEYGREAVL